MKCPEVGIWVDYGSWTQRHAGSSDAQRQHNPEQRKALLQSVTASIQK